MSDVAAQLRPILLIDDDPGAALIASMLLRRARIPNPIVTVPGSVEGIEYLAGRYVPDSGCWQMPGVVIVDVVMAIPGFEVLRWIRSNPPLLRLGVIMWSASADDHEPVRAKELGADYFFLKFPEAQVLADAVRTCLGYDAQPLNPTVPL